MGEDRILMIFHKTHQQVLDGTKTQTRRPRKLFQETSGGIDPIHRIDEVYQIREAGDTWCRVRRIYEVDKTYAVQLGRGKKSLGRIKLLKIRLEHVQSISCKDIIAEGLRTNLRKIDATMDLLQQWEELWDSIYGRTGFAWKYNPQVWVLEFELVEKY